MKLLTLIKDVQDIPLKANKNWNLVQKLKTYTSFVLSLSYYVSYSDDDMVSGTSAATTTTWGDCILAIEETNIKTLCKSLGNPWKTLRPFGFSGILSVASLNVLNL